MCVRKGCVCAPKRTPGAAFGLLYIGVSISVKIPSALLLGLTQVIQLVDLEHGETEGDHDGSQYQAE